MIIKTNSAAETEAVAEALAERFLKDGKHNIFIALYGEMGVGKTAFCRGFCRKLGILRVKSPTYTVVNEYRSNICPVFHFDMYRLSGEKETETVGFDEYLSRNGFKLCEWSERLNDCPEGTVSVRLSRGEKEEERIIQITGEADNRNENTRP